MQDLGKLIFLKLIYDGFESEFSEACWTGLTEERKAAYRQAANDVIEANRVVKRGRRGFWFLDLFWQPFWNPIDLWVGLFVHPQKKAVYFCPLPTLGVRVSRGE